jgi:predicted  nucleic acid-binding Zn-ribbon protein
VQRLSCVRRRTDAAGAALHPGPLIDNLVAPAQPDADSSIQPEGIPMSKQDVYVAKMKVQLDELNLKMTELEAKAKDAKHEAKAAYDAEMGKLRDQSRLAGAKLDELKDAAEGTWHKMVADMEKLRNAFTSSFNYFKSQV